MTWLVAARVEFSAGHALRNYNGKCERPHGHNFQVEARIIGEKLDAATGILFDFSILKKLLARAVEPLDHADLNKVAPFDRINPSSENLARHIWEFLEKEIALDAGARARGARLERVTVSEKEGQEASYLGENCGNTG